MNEQLQKQYDSLYRVNDCMYGDGAPLKSVQRLTEYIKTGRVLDIGGGQGRNALYLAAQGFSVEVRDLSAVGLNILLSKAAEQKLNVTTKVADVTVAGVSDWYDVVLMSFMLHHLTNAQAVTLIKESKAHTNPNGVHVIATFASVGELYERNKKEMININYVRI